MCMLAVCATPCPRRCGLFSAAVRCQQNRVSRLVRVGTRRTAAFASILPRSSAYRAVLPRSAEPSRGEKSVAPAIVLPGRKKSIRVATRGCPIWKRHCGKTMVRAARAALALLTLPCVDAALKTYANASTELTNLEHFFDAHLSTGLPALLGARPPVDGDVDKALKGCAKTGLALDACPALLEVLSVPRYAAHDYVARAAGLRNASQESASPLFLYGGAKDDGCTKPAHSLYAVLKGTASATGAFGTAKLDDDAKAMLFVPGNDDKLTFTVSKGAAVRFCVVDASNVHSVRRLAKESPDVHFPHAKSLVISELLTALDDPEFDFVMARSYSEMPWSEFATRVARVRRSRRRPDHDYRAGGRGPRRRKNPCTSKPNASARTSAPGSPSSAGTGAS